MGKISVRLVQKKILHQQCCVKQQYTEQWKIVELQVQCMMKMKQEKPLFFSNEVQLTYV
jgi:hypothetical protein